MKLFVAPLQGYTTAPYRHFHALVYGHTLGSEGEVTYLTPFLRIERGEVRRKEVADLCSPLNENHRLVPQIIFSNPTEFDRLVDVVAESGYNHVNLNLGCPFPLQTGRGRGSAMVGDVEAFQWLAKSVERRSGDVAFSVKMRLGLMDSHEWAATIDTLNAMNLEWVAMHGRVGRQQYKGNVDAGELKEFAWALRHPLIVNGDITSVGDIAANSNCYGVMVGRGILARPSLFNEFQTATTDTNPLVRLTEMHDYLLDHYRATVTGGDHVIKSLIKAFWEYTEPTVGRKFWKNKMKGRE